MLFRRRENMPSYRYFILFLFVIFQFRINYFESFRGKERAREKAALQFMMKIDEMRWVVWARIVYSHLLKFVCKHQLHKSFKRRAYSFHIHFFLSSSFNSHLFDCSSALNSSNNNGKNNSGNGSNGDSNTNRFNASPAPFKCVQAAQRVSINLFAWQFKLFTYALFFDLNRSVLCK